MRKFRAALLTAALTITLVGGLTTAASAAPGSKVKGFGTFDVGGQTFTFSFNGSGDGLKSAGGFIVTDPQGDFVSGKASCFFRDGNSNKAAISGFINRKSGDTAFSSGDYLVITGLDSGSPAVQDQIDVRIADSAICSPNNPTLPIETGYVDVT